MIEIFLKTLPFFTIIGIGFVSAWRGFFSSEATVYLTKFVFYFALSAMLFRFSARLDLSAVFSWDFVFAYLSASLLLYAASFALSMGQGTPVSEAAVEAQCSVIGNVGFLGLPMLAMLMGAEAVGYVMIVLAIDLIVFGSLIVVFIVWSREQTMQITIVITLLAGLLRNPMIVAICAGLLWTFFDIPMPDPLWDLVTLLGAAATPCALFAIGASLAEKTTERARVAFGLSFAKLVLHPAAVAFSVLWLFELPPYPAAVMIVASALPVAGNIYILAQHYGVAPQRVSASILVSTALSIVTVTGIMALVEPLASF